MVLGFQNIGDALTMRIKKAYIISLYAVCDLKSLLEPDNEDRAVDNLAYDVDLDILHRLK